MLISFSHFKTLSCSTRAACRNFTYSKRPKTRPAQDKLTIFFDNLSKTNNCVKKPASSSSTGLFGYKDLATPADFEKILTIRLKQANEILGLVLSNLDDPKELAKTVQRLDALSDYLCSVVDAAEVIRHVHPKNKWVNASDKAHSVLSNFLSQLNTHQGLYMALKKVYENPSLYKSQVSEQEYQVGRLLIEDFEKSGIHMEKDKRKAYVSLYDKILQNGQEFVTNAGPAIDHIEISNPYTVLEGLPKEAIASLVSYSEKEDTALIPIGHPISHYILKCGNEIVREKVWTALNSGSDRQIHVLEEMLKTRHDIANLVGRNNYAEVHLQDKMAKTPETVSSFLNSLAKLHLPKVQQDFNRLQNIKRSHTNNPSATLKPWDKLFYNQFISSSLEDVSSTLDEQHSPSSDPFHTHHNQKSLARDSTISRYLSIGTVFSGLNRILNSLYGITLSPAPVDNGEVWHEDVVKLNVVHEHEGKIGVIYCDLFSREHEGDLRKFESAAHFTVRCSRRIDEDNNIFTTTDSGNKNSTFLTKYFSLLRNPDTERTVKDGNVDKTYQMPLVVLVTSFSKSNSNDRPSLLSLAEVETLFHEMGHSIHSMLARTDFQHIAGTRCPIDFVEVPSIFTEYFAKSPQVLCSFASDYQTGEPLPLSLINAHKETSSHLESFETHNQIQLAILDMLYHTHKIDKTVTSTTLYEQVQRQVGVFEHIDGTKWQAQFSHLLTYGSSYYSYFWSRRWASRIWKGLFFNNEDEMEYLKNIQVGTAEEQLRYQKDFIENMGRVKWRRGGELIKLELLQVGGGRDPWIGLEKVGVVNEGERNDSSLKSLDEIL